MKTKTAIWIVVLMLGAVGLPSLVALTYWLGYRHGHSTIHTRTAETLQVAGMSREAVLQMFPRKTWYSHWENRNRNHPVEISVGDDGQVFVGDDTHKNWKLELRWVLNEGSHLYLPIDDYTVHGFFISSGRQKGLFADKPK